MEDEFTFNFDTTDSEEEFEGFGPEDLCSDLEVSDPDWSSDDDTPLADMIPLSNLQHQEERATENAATGPPTLFNWSSNIRDGQLEEFTGTPGATTVLPTNSREIDFFHLIFPFTLFEWIARQTNLYATQRQRERGKTDSAWTATTAREMMAFIGIKIYMALVDLPTYKLYWSRNWLFTTPLSSIITRNRYKKIAYFQVCSYFISVLLQKKNRI